VDKIINRLCLCIIVAIGLTLPAFGQSTLNEQLVGTWTLVSCSGADGSERPYCVGTNGIDILDASRQYAKITAARGRSKFRDAVTRPLDAFSPEEYKAAAMGLVANFGTW
jgi:hypothetical protein